MEKGKRKEKREDRKKGGCREGMGEIEEEKKREVEKEV